MDKFEEKGNNVLRLVVLGFKWMLSFFLIFVAGVFVTRLVGVMWFTDSFEKSIEQNPTLVIGLPLAALTALALVLSLEQKSEKIKFKAIGFEFQGASGQIVLWVICFLAISLCIRLLA